MELLIRFMREGPLMAEWTYSVPVGTHPEIGALFFSTRDGFDFVGHLQGQSPVFQTRDGIRLVFRSVSAE